MMTCGRLRRWQWQVASFSLLISLALGKSSPPPSPADLCSLVALAALSAHGFSHRQSTQNPDGHSKEKLSLERRDSFLAACWRNAANAGALHRCRCCGRGAVGESLACAPASGVSVVRGRGSTRRTKAQLPPRQRAVVDVVQSLTGGHFVLSWAVPTQRLIHAIASRRQRY